MSSFTAQSSRRPIGVNPALGVDEVTGGQELRVSCGEVAPALPAQFDVNMDTFRSIQRRRPSGVRFALGVCAGWFALTGLDEAFAEGVDVRRDATVAAIERVLPSVVNIATETVIEYHDWYENLLRQFYGWERVPVRQRKFPSLGSGVIIDEDGYVLTNFHVVRRANRVQVKLWDGREYEADGVVATPLSDVALLKIRAKSGEKFKAIKLAADDDLLLGETVMALGNPFGLGGSVTKGILSSKNRRPATGDEPLNVEDWLQTDAAINPGNSGGPLVNLRGELIGLNVAVYREERGERGMGVGFSIPVKQVSAALSRFFTPEVTDSLWFGAQFKSGPGPLKVISVVPGSPAWKGGLRTNDIVQQINGAAPEGLTDAHRLIRAATDHKVNLVAVRGDESRTVRLTLVPFETLIQEKLGLTLLEVTPQAAERLGVAAGQGLYIEEVEARSPAGRAQLQRGYLVSAINGKPTTEVRTVAEEVALKERGEVVHLGLIVPRRLGANYIEFRQGTVDLEIR
jgi:serine protease Do